MAAGLPTSASQYIILPEVMVPFNLTAAFVGLQLDTSVSILSPGYHFALHGSTEAYYF